MPPNPPHQPPLAAAQRINAIQRPVIPLIGQWIKAHPQTINLGQGMVSYPPPETLRGAVESFFHDPLNHRYQPAAGIPALTEIIRQKLSHENGISIGSEQALYITAGSNMAFLQAILAIVDSGDEIIILSPYYFNHEMAIRMASGVPVIVPTDAAHQPQLELIAAAITPRTRAIVTTSPNNPTGAVYSRDTLAAINALCARHGLYHISDEAYEYFLYDQVPHLSPASLPHSAAHTISLFSLSKAYAMASWRVGYMVLPAHLAEAMHKIQDTNLICAPAITQHAAVAAIKAGRRYCEPYIHQLAQTRQQLITLLANHTLRTVAPQGAFYFLIYDDKKSVSDMLQLTHHLITHHHVAALPGITFGVEGPCCFRISYGALDTASALEGVSRLIAGIRSL